MPEGGQSTFMASEVSGLDPQLIAASQFEPCASIAERTENQYQDIPLPELGEDESENLRIQNTVVITPAKNISVQVYDMEEEAEINFQYREEDQDIALQTSLRIDSRNVQNVQKERTKSPVKLVSIRMEDLFRPVPKKSSLPAKKILAKV